MLRKKFPKGIASGAQFFNRTDEIACLKANIESGVHTLIIAPRRYGKSSLAKHVIKQSRLPYAEIDLFVAVDDADIAKKIFQGISRVMKQALGKPEKWITVLRDYFERANKHWTIGLQGMTLELIAPHDKMPADNIMDALLALEHVLKKQKQHVVIFIDEVQEIFQLPTGKALEGVLRHFAQESEHVVFVFSGSARHLLEKMFKDSVRPLYALCDELRLGRIAPHYYEKYLNRLAKDTWQHTLPEEVLNWMLAETECHPRYVYIAALEVWLKAGKTMPTLTQAKAAWKGYVQLQQKTFENCSLGAPRYKESYCV
jgi:AAA+ ATPase superfamily predicted ATPase